MGQRSNAIADRIELGAKGLATFAEGLSDADWKKVVKPDGRTVGVMINHVASVYPIEIQLAQGVASGAAMTGVTYEGAVKDMNAKHAADNAAVGKAETVALLRTNSKAAADAVRKMSDAELDRAAPVSLNSDAVLTAQFVLEDHAVRHSWHHLAKVKGALAR